jgi:hypothetical protein
MNGIVVISSCSRQAKSIVYFMINLQWHQIADLAWAYCLGQLVSQSSPGPTTEFYLPSCKLSSSMLLYAMKKYPDSSQTREPKECFVVKTQEIATFYSPAVNKVRKCMQIFSS